MSRALEKAVITRAKAILSNHNRWAIDVISTDKYGNRCSPHDPLAVKFCGLGALTRAAGELIKNRGEARRFALCVAMGIEDTTKCCIDDINDTVGRHAVIALFDAALAA